MRLAMCWLCRLGLFFNCSVVVPGGKGAMCARMAAAGDMIVTAVQAFKWAVARNICSEAGGQVTMLT
jgi:hypothetical protein